jgi:hypothetical protein
MPSSLLLLDSRVIDKDDAALRQRFAAVRAMHPDRAVDPGLSWSENW